ncbi:MAG: ATP-binding cassette domain-containing protein, partial [Oscillospiraceae bacterium]|nr:ATP-binding cassette domain-containing protein [Oscillospiraceae bacterium]
MLKVTNLYKSFGDKTVLNNISFELGDGEILCLRGKSGAGKTTLIRCICNLDKANEGSIV